MADFEIWLSGLLGQRKDAAKRLLSDRTALHFLIAWSLFESKCAGGRFEMKSLLDEKFFPAPIAAEQVSLRDLAATFHARYQDANRLSTLAPSELTPRDVLGKMQTLLLLPETQLSAIDHCFVCAFVAARIRNNMFHGVKGIDDWLRDKSLIEKGIGVLQLFVSGAERVRPTLTLATA